MKCDCNLTQIVFSEEQTQSTSEIISTNVSYKENAEQILTTTPAYDG
jgi:hypothetical protein